MSTSIPESFFDKITKINTNIDVTVPSQSNVVETSSMNLKQQKDLISTAADGIVGILNFSIIQGNTILTNTGRDDLYVFDKVPVTVAMRVDSLGESVSLDDKTSINLNRVIDRVKESTTEFELKKRVEIDSIVLQLSIPTIKKDIKISKRCVKEMEKLTVDDKDSDSVGLIYIFELIKYIDSITLGEDEVIFDNISIDDRVKFVEALPLKFYNELSAFFKQVSMYDKELLTFDGKKVSIDSSFFDVSDTNE